MLPTVFLDGVPADQIGRVDELSFSRSFGAGQGGGLRDLKITLDLGDHDHHPSLRLHAPVDLRHGAESLGEGRIVSIDRDTWEIVADGIVRLGEDYECRGADSEPASLAVGLPLAIGRGLPWVIPDGLTLPADVPESMQTISEALTAYCNQSGKRWLLDGRTLRIVDDPVSPTLILTATDNPNSSTDGLVTSVTAKYAGAVDEQGRPALISYVTVGADNVPKRVERTIDLTGEGALTESDAADRARSQLVAGTTATLTESVAVAEGTLTMHDGKDLSEVLCTVRDGQMVRQLDWVNPDGSPGLYRDWIIGAVDWALDDGLVLTPMGAESSTLTGAIIDIRRGIAEVAEKADETEATASELPFDIQDALDAADAAQEFAEAKTQVFRQTSMPTYSGDAGTAIWFDTDDGNKLYIWTGSTFTVATTSHLTTPNGRLVVNTGGLFGYDSIGNLKVSIDAGTGNLWTSGQVHVGGEVSGALVTGGTVQTDSSTGVNRTGVKMSNSGIAAYHPTTHEPVLEFLTSTGALLIKGEIKSGSSIKGATLEGTLSISGGKISGGIVETSGSGIRAALETSGSVGRLAMYDNGTYLGGLSYLSPYGLFLATAAGVFGPYVGIESGRIAIVSPSAPVEIDGGIKVLGVGLDMNGLNITNIKQISGDGTAVGFLSNAQMNGNNVNAVGSLSFDSWGSVARGAADSGGTGYRVLRVPN